MNDSRRTLVRTSVSSALSLLLVTVSSAALAQTQTAPPPDSAATPNDASAVQQSLDSTKPDAQGDTKDVVVTGSRIRRDNSTTPSEISVISKQELDLNGQRDIASALQAGSVTSGGSQINGAFLGFVSQNGPAANTVGLRGLGSERTLVLLNGRRLAPAGVGPQLVAADLNVLPNALIDRVEILREGASSVYGSDAIGGVINIITDFKLNGITVEGYDDQPTHTGCAGNTIRTSIAAGKVFDRGHITASFEFRDQQGLIRNDRAGFSCPRDLLFSPTTGAEVGSIDPATGGLSCYPYSLGSGSGIASGYGIGINFTNGATNRLTYANGDFGTLQTVNGLNRVTPSPYQNYDTVISPVRTYTGYVNGSYDTGLLGDAEIYGEGLFTRRSSHQVNPLQISITQKPLSPNIQIYGGTYAGLPLSDPALGYPTSPFFPNAVAAAGYNYFTPFVLPQQLQQNSQRIDYVRANGGVRGHLPFGDWRYDANFQYSHTDGVSVTSQTTTTRFSNALQAVLAPAGTPANLITTAVAGEAGAGNNYTCASNVSAAGTFIAGSTCVPFDIYNPATLLRGQVPAGVFNYLYQPDVDHTTFNEQIISLNVDGTLFTLPAGGVKLALGYEHRYDAINDTPSAASQAGQLYNYSNSGITKGSDQVNEAYGELDVPLLRDSPIAKFAEVDISGRYTNYRSYGTDFTYHVTGQYQVNDIVRFRGNYGTSFRAPNLYEQFVANQTGFLGSGSDPCSGFGIGAAAGTTLYNNCLAALTPSLGQAGALSYIATQGPEEITEGGAGRLKAETATTWGGGIVLTAPHRFLGLTLAVDYFNITVNGEVSQLGSTILSRCYEATDFATNPYCALIAPREVGGAHPGALVSFQNPYLNVALQKASGIDFDLQYNTLISGYRFTGRVQATRNLHQEYQPFAGEDIVDYNGTLGEQGFGAGPKLIGNFDTELTNPAKTITLHYGLRYVGRQDSTALIGPYNAGLGLGPVNTIFYTHPYFEHAISLKFSFPNMGDFTLGATNLTNSHPPVVSQTPTSDGQYTRIGNYFNSSNYDYYGRSLFVHFSHTFK